MITFKFIRNIFLMVVDFELRENNLWVSSTFSHSCPVTSSDQVCMNNNNQIIEEHNAVLIYLLNTFKN